MSWPMNRREFLKMGLGLLASLAVPWDRAAVTARTHPGSQRPPNVLILVFDAFSALNASLHAYPRQTTPNLAQLAARATGYHRHYAAGNFTNPGTASLLSGTYPWTHRTLQLFDSVAKPLAGNSIFREFAAAGYRTVAYSHNLQALSVLEAFRPDIHQFIPLQELCLLDNHFSDLLFAKDYNVAVWQERLFHGADRIHARSTSLLLRSLSQKIWSAQVRSLEARYGELFPRGLPKMHDQIFLLEDAVDWLASNLPQIPQPFMVYFHVIPPHGPCNPRREFVGLFDDSWRPPHKPRSFFPQGPSDELQNYHRRQYDEYIAYTDAEFGRLYRSLERAGTLDDTYVVVTSDHGELFERGIMGHFTQTLYEPIVRIPLLIFQPGQSKRKDVYAPTSCVDVLPTLLHAAGQPIPDWCEGQVLPSFASEARLEERSLYVVEAKRNRKYRALTKATVAIVKGPYKLVHYFGYPLHQDAYELYDVDNDPEELNDLYESRKELAQPLRAELLSKLEEVNRPFA